MLCISLCKLLIQCSDLGQGVQRLAMSEHIIPTLWFTTVEGPLGVWGERFLLCVSVCLCVRCARTPPRSLVLSSSNFVHNVNLPSTIPLPYTAQQLHPTCLFTTSLGPKRLRGRLLLATVSMPILAETGDPPRGLPYWEWSSR